MVFGKEAESIDCSRRCTDLVSEGSSLHKPLILIGTSSTLHAEINLSIGVQRLSLKELWMSDQSINLTNIHAFTPSDLNILCQALALAALHQMAYVPEDSL